eukprot:scaffold100203_cov28-Tisochrysis_lutea.AAC.3
MPLASQACESYQGRERHRQAARYSPLDRQGAAQIRRGASQWKGQTGERLDRVPTSRRRGCAAYPQAQHMRAWDQSAPSRRGCAPQPSESAGGGTPTGPLQTLSTQLGPSRQRGARHPSWWPARCRGPIHRRPEGTHAVQTGRMFRRGYARGQARATLAGRGAGAHVAEREQLDVATRGVAEEVLEPQLTASKSLSVHVRGAARGLEDEAGGITHSHCTHLCNLIEELSSAHELAHFAEPTLDVLEPADHVHHVWVRRCRVGAQVEVRVAFGDDFDRDIRVGRVCELGRDHGAGGASGEEGVLVDLCALQVLLHAAVSHHGGPCVRVWGR